MEVIQNVGDTVTSLPDLASLDVADLERLFVERGWERFRARQVFGWIYKKGVTDIDAMTNLPRDLRAALATEARITTPRLSSRERSSDGTEKFLLALADGRHIESVFIPDTPAMTFCISTQVGCAMACAFCLTGKMGLVRNLTAGEIAGQVRVLAGALDLRDKPFNIVLMGMGEPLHNYDAVMKAMSILCDEHGFHLPPRRVTLSTVGLLPALERLGQEALMPNLAISLHAPTDEQRGALVPINRKYGVAEIIDACRRFPVRKRDRITFEYVMLAGVNDAPEDARRLARLLSGVKGKVNLIPLNAAAGIPFERPSDDVVDRFARILSERDVTVSVRKSRGRDIRAACGQLIVEGQKPSAGQRLATVLR
ncbi:MAG: 23S rRNA (adenine(2503)-C(2))-methyltransferase RlmN [Vicinamibacterales bacterium]